MSELSPVSHITPFDGGLLDMRRSAAPLSSVGWTVSNAASKIVDPETGDEIDPPAEGLSETGRAVVQGTQRDGRLPQQRRGDPRRPSTTTASCTPATSRRSTPRGCVYIVDRLKELIKYKGYQVPPAELEAVLLSHPADRRRRGRSGSHDAERRGGAKGVRGQAIRDAELTEDEVMEFVAEHVAPYKKVRQVEFIDADPEVGVGQDPAQGSARDLAEESRSPRFDLPVVSGHCPRRECASWDGRPGVPEGTAR